MGMQYAFQTPTSLHLVLDFCSGGELFFHLSRFGKFPEHVARFYTAELVLAVEFLHQKGVAYRDLKPENVLLDAAGHIKLGDFGLCKCDIFDATQGATSMCGTPEYMAPEIITKVGHGTGVDWWSLGMLMFEMLTGLPPWFTKDRQKLFQRLRCAPLKVPSFLSRECARLIGGLLERNPRERLGVKGGVASIKRHAFFSLKYTQKSVSPKALAKFFEKRPVPRVYVYETVSEDFDWSRIAMKECTPPVDPRRQEVGSGGGSGGGKGGGGGGLGDGGGDEDDTSENAAAVIKNFDECFTTLALEEDDGSAGAGAGAKDSNDEDDTFTRFSRFSFSGFDVASDEQPGTDEDDNEATEIARLERELALLKAQVEADYESENEGCDDDIQDEQKVVLTRQPGSEGASSGSGEIHMTGDEIQTPLMTPEEKPGEKGPVQRRNGDELEVNRSNRRSGIFRWFMGATM